MLTPRALAARGKITRDSENWILGVGVGFSALGELGLMGFSWGFAPLGGWLDEAGGFGIASRPQEFDFSMLNTMVFVSNGFIGASWVAWATSKVQQCLWSHSSDMALSWGYAWMDRSLVVGSTPKSLGAIESLEAQKRFKITKECIPNATLKWRTIIKRPEKTS